MKECLVCGEPVGAARLKAVPTARRCRDCQAGDEEKNPVRRVGVSDVLGVVLVSGEQLDPEEEMRATR